MYYTEEVVKIILMTKRLLIKSYDHKDADDIYPVVS